MVPTAAAMASLGAPAALMQPGMLAAVLAAVPACAEPSGPHARDASRGEESICRLLRDVWNARLATWTLEQDCRLTALMTTRQVKACGAVYAECMDGRAALEPGELSPKAWTCLEADGDVVVALLRQGAASSRSCAEPPVEALERCFERAVGSYFSRVEQLSCSLLEGSEASPPQLPLLEAVLSSEPACASLLDDCPAWAALDAWLGL